MCFWWSAWRTVSWCDVMCHDVWSHDRMCVLWCVMASTVKCWNVLRLQMLWIRGDHPHGFSIDCWRVWLGSSWKWWPHWGEQSRLGEQILQQTSTHVWFAGKLCNVSVKFFSSFYWIPFTMRISIGRKKYFFVTKNITRRDQANNYGGTGQMSVS